MQHLEIIKNTVSLYGEWTWLSLKELTTAEVAMLPCNTAINIDATKITDIDSTGAFFIKQLLLQLTIRNNTIVQQELGIATQLYDMIINIHPYQNSVPIVTYSAIRHIGEKAVNTALQTRQIIVFFGYICYHLALLWQNITKLYVTEMLYTIINCGIKGIAISSTLCFLLGVNLAYQMSPQFISYGANVYVVNFLGIALLREITPLITAITVAGRTGSAITAAICTMQLQEELDALKIMGISVVLRLILPILIGLLISLPILTMLADVFSMLGGMLVAKNTLGVSYSLFIHRVHDYVSISNYLVGLIKSVAFAWIIAMVSCLCGLEITGSANNVGIQTTKSVVLSISLIVVVDASFAILFKTLSF